jgi:hypothetical protein
MIIICLLYSDLYYKPITIINDDSSIINKLKTSVTDDATVIIYHRHMFIVQATGHSLIHYCLRNAGKARSLHSEHIKALSLISNIRLG